MPNNINVNTNVSTGTDSMDDVDLSLYGLNTPEEEMPAQEPGDKAVIGNAVTGSTAGGNVPPRISGPLDFVRDAIKEYRTQDAYTIDDLTDTDRARAIAAEVFFIGARKGEAYNMIRSKEMKIPTSCYRINLEMAAALITSTGDTAVLDFGAGGNSGLYVYSYTGSRAGMWTHAQGGGMDIVYKILATLGVRQAEQNERAVLRVLTMTSEQLRARRGTDLLAFANGVVDYSGGAPQFTPYLDKDGDANQTYTSIYGKGAYITSKAGVNYNPAAALPVFTCSNGEKWDPLTHIEMVTGGNADAMTILLQSAIFVLKGISGGGVIWFMDGTRNGNGGGGKSSIGNILATVAGPGMTGYINLETIAADRFGLGEIVGKTFLFGNETSAGNKAIERTDQIKALMRGEPVRIETKFKDPYSYDFSGVWVQCMNCAAPKFAERENATYRRVIPVYFPQDFVNQGKEELLEIKEVFCKDPSVGEHLVMHALDLYGNIDRYDQGAVARLREKLKDIRAEGSTAFEFLNTYATEIKSRATPVGMLFRFYVRWIKLNGYGTPLDLKAFRKEVQQWTASAPGWTFERRGTNNRAKTDEAICVETYMTENPVPGYADYSAYPGKAFVLSDRLKNHRDRDWLIQDRERELTQDEAARLYAAYRAAALAAYVDTGAAADGMAPGEFVLGDGDWTAVGRIAPEYTAPVSNPGGRGFWTRSGGGVIVISPEGYKRAVTKARTDRNVLRDFKAFFKAAQTVNRFGAATW